MWSHFNCLFGLCRELLGSHSWIRTPVVGQRLVINTPSGWGQLVSGPHPLVIITVVATKRAGLVWLIFHLAALRSIHMSYFWQLLSITISWFHSFLYVHVNSNMWWGSLRWLRTGSMATWSFSNIFLGLNHIRKVLFPLFSSLLYVGLSMG